MAFTDDTFRIAITGSLTALGSSDSSRTYSADIFVAGTFVGTVAVEAQDTDGDWHTVCSFTEPFVRTVRFARSRPVRVTVSAFTSGTINYQIESIIAYENAR